MSRQQVGFRDLPCSSDQRRRGPSQNLAKSPRKAPRNRPLAPERLFNLIQRFALRLRHEDEAHRGREERTPAEQEVGPEAALRQQYRGRECDEEVCHPVAPVREVGGRRARPLRLALRHVDLDADGPGEGEYRDEDVDGNDDDPAACSRAVVDRVARVEAADQEHGDANAESAVNGAGSTAPFVGIEKGGDGYAEDDNRRDARSEKGSFRGGEAGLREQKRCVLCRVGEILCVSEMERGLT